MTGELARAIANVVREQGSRTEPGQEVRIVVNEECPWCETSLRFEVAELMSDEQGCTSCGSRWDLAESREELDLAA